MDLSQPVRQHWQVAAPACLEPWCESAGERRKLFTEGMYSKWVPRAR